MSQNPIIEADQIHISSIINNLLDNAEKYTPERPEIVITTRDVKGEIEFDVSDNGIGMTKDAFKAHFRKILSSTYWQCT